MNKTKTVGIHTLGCRVNQYESCAIAERLRECGITVSKSSQCDYYIVNTCAVTAESERKSRQMIRRFAAKGKVLVIGCASQLDPELYNIDNVIYVGGNRNKSIVADIICGDIEAEKMSVLSMDNAPYEEMKLSEKSELFSECRAFIKIQDGCNGKCTYCIIPKCRGNVRSRSVEAIIAEAKQLASVGYREIILTGIEVGAYNKAPLSELIRTISKINEIERLRLGSLSPNVISTNFLEAAAASDSFMPHMHLSIQSCSDKILKAMLRPYRKQDVIDKVKMIREYIPGCMISADIIVGFPGETEEDFLETVNTLNQLEVFHIHSFPYSEREGTVAATMQGSVPKHIRAERNARLIAECAATRERILDSMLGKTMSVLVEKVKDGYAHGHTKEFLEACFPSNQYTVGDIAEINIISHDGTVLNGI